MNSNLPGSPLHSAVLKDQLAHIQALSQAKDLTEDRNYWGLTAFELAAFLHKKKSVEILSQGKVPQSDYLSQPNVEFTEPERVKNLHFDYLTHPIFANVEVLEDILSHNHLLKQENKIPHNRIWMGIYYSKEIQFGFHPRVSVQWIDSEIGFGVFAEERIMPCSFIGEYTGLVQERQGKHKRESNYCVRYTNWPVGKKVYVIDAERMGNFTRHLNHSDNPNTTLVCASFRGLPRILIISLKEVPQGTQLTFDYGKTFWKQSPQLVKRLLSN